MSEPNPFQPGRPTPDPFSAPPVPEHEMSVPQRPGAVTAAFWLAVVVPVLATLLDVGMAWWQGDEMRSALGGGADPIDDAAAQVAVGATIVGTALLDVVLTTLWIVFGFQMRAGRQWARVTLTVFAGIWVASSLLGLVSAAVLQFAGPSLLEQPGSAGIGGLVQGLVFLGAMIAFIVLVYRPSSNAFFRATRRY